MFRILPDGFVDAVFSTSLGLLALAAGPGVFAGKTITDLASDQFKQLCVQWGKSPGNIPPSVVSEMVQVFYFHVEPSYFHT